MIELLSEFSLTQIVICIFLVLIACKELLGIIDYFYVRIKGYALKDEKKKDEHEDLLKEIKNLEKDFAEFKADYEQVQAKQNERLDLLTKSDVASIRSSIVEKYHHFKEKGSIDDFSLDAIEKIYTYYKEEGGNSYVGNLIKELRQLPHN